MKFLYIIFLVLFCNGLSAQTYKCVKDGKTVYSGLPCDRQSAQKLFEEKSTEQIQAKPVFNEYKVISDTPVVLPNVINDKKPLASHADRYAWTWQELRQALGWEEVLIIFAFYFFPSMIALGRKHHNRAAIVLLNLFLGWTALGWIAALVWSATSVIRRDQ